jgi:hypothetical protein
MVEKRVVTKDKNGEVVNVIEHYDLTLEHKQKMATYRIILCIGLLLGWLAKSYFQLSPVLSRYGFGP